MRRNSSDEPRGTKKENENVYKFYLEASRGPKRLSYNS